MTIEKLYNILEELIEFGDGGALFVVSKDSEGNAFHIANDFSFGTYDESDSDFYDSEEGVEGEKAVCFWP